MNKKQINLSIYNNLITALQKDIDKKTPVILAIDGMCGSGKTSLAEYLTTKFNAAVIHMDNFFLPFERKTPERLAEPGGNIDYERFIEVVIPALKKRKPFSYIAFNCQTASYDRKTTIPDCDLIIVEGSYCLHEKFGKYYDFAVFLSIPGDVQLNRLEKRCNDDQKFQRFKTEWIPMENHYHQSQNISARCNICIDTSM